MDTNEQIKPKGITDLSATEAESQSFLQDVSNLLDGATTAAKEINIKQDNAINRFMYELNGAVADKNKTFSAAEEILNKANANNKEQINLNHKVTSEINSTLERADDNFINEVVQLTNASENELIVQPH